MLLKITEVKNTIKAKGTVVAVDDSGIHICDPKTEEVAILTLDAFKIFLNKEINFSVSENAKSEEEIVEGEEE